MMAEPVVERSASSMSRSWRTKLQDFQGFTLAHPKLVDTKNKLMVAIQDSPPNSLVMVVGPTGVGKTTLVAKIEQILTQTLVSVLQADRGRIPVVSVEAVAPESGNFNLAGSVQADSTEDEGAAGRVQASSSNPAPWRQ